MYQSLKPSDLLNLYTTSSEQFISTRLVQKVNNFSLGLKKKEITLAPKFLMSITFPFCYRCNRISGTIPS